MEFILKTMSVIFVTLGGIAAIRIIVWAIFSGYFLALDRKSLWSCLDIS